MPSTAYTHRLEVVLQDADEINQGHGTLRTGRPGRQFGLGALNRAVVVMCVSAWEAYIEEMLKESLEFIRPQAPPLGVWPALNASARSQIGRFNNPNVQKTKELVRDCLGLDDITQCWTWTRTQPARACERLEECITFRHQIAHGVTPRPIIHNQQYASRLPAFFRNLGRTTDNGITSYLNSTLGVHTGW